MAKPVEIDLSEFEQEPRRSPKCSISVAFQLLSEEQVAKATAAMKTPTITSASISRIVSKWSSAKVSAQSISRHRRGDCSCD